MFELLIELGVLLSFFIILFHAIRYKKQNLILLLLINAFILEEHAYLIYKKVVYADFNLMVFNIPLWIILGWVIPLYLLIFLIGKVKRLDGKGKIALLGLTMLLIDILLEPFAYIFKWWAWASGKIYYLNDLFAWVLFSLLVGYFFFYYKEKDFLEILKKSVMLQILGILVGFIWFNIPNLLGIIIFSLIVSLLIIILIIQLFKFRTVE